MPQPISQDDVVFRSTDRCARGQVIHLIPSLDWGNHAFHMRTVIDAIAPDWASTVYTLSQPSRPSEGDLTVCQQHVRSPFDLPSLWQLAKRLEAASCLVITWGNANRLMHGFWRLGVRPARWLATSVGDRLPPQRPQVGQLQIGYDGDEGTQNGMLRAPQAKLGYRVGAATAKSQAAPTWREQLRLPAGAKLVGIAGGLPPDDNLKDAIWAADLLKVVRDDVHLLLIGNGPDRWRWENFRRAVHIEDRVHFIEPSNAEALIAGLDCYWAPGRVPGLGWGPLVAANAGVPIVATRQGEQARLLSSLEEHCLFEPGDRAALARLTTRIFDEADVAARVHDRMKTDYQQRWQVTPAWRHSLLQLIEGVIQSK